MSAVQRVGDKQTLCTNCGIPADSECFDASGFATWPPPGNELEVVLASFELPHQYCGVLECFSQYTDVFLTNLAAVETPDIEWRILVNRRPLYPYVNVQAILNPWGFGNFSLRLRLPEAARVEFVARRNAAATVSAVQRVGGRISGHYWFNRG